MKIYKEERLKDFAFWAGAKYRAEKLTEAEFEIIESLLEDIYPEGLSETAINDLFWFDEDFIAECLGLAWEEIEVR